MSRVAVLGAGISGAACAAALRARGMGVDVFDRARAPGGRMASPTLHGRRVDLGAAYFTVDQRDFGDVVRGWAAAGLAREWTTTLDVFGAESHRSSSSGPTRWAARAGLRSLVGDLNPDPVLAHEVTALDEFDHDAVVLAMPDPQAARIVGDVTDWVGYEPVIAVAAGWTSRCWPIEHAAFVNDDADITLVVDDGSRRGDAAPVLVVHTTAELARRHLEDPDAAVPPLLAALRRVVDVNAAPSWVHAHRWTFAKPAGTHGDAQFLVTEVGGRPIGLCGDSWCPRGSPRVEAAWLSGHRLGTVLAGQLESDKQP